MRNKVLMEVLSHVDCAEEKKPVKRSYQKIQEEEEDEDDDYRSHNSPRNTGGSATQLVGGFSCRSGRQTGGCGSVFSLLSLSHCRRRSW